MLASDTGGGAVIGSCCLGVQGRGGGVSGSRVLPALDLLTSSHGTLRSTASGFRSCGSPGSRNEEAGVLWSLRVLRRDSGFRGHQVGNLCHLWRHFSEQGAPEPLGTGSVGAPELLSLWGLGAWWPMGARSWGPWETGSMVACGSLLPGTLGTDNVGTHSWGPRAL